MTEEPEKKGFLDKLSEWMPGAKEALGELKEAAKDLKPHFKKGAQKVGEYSRKVAGEVKGGVDEAKTIASELTQKVHKKKEEEEHNLGEPPPPEDDQK